MGRSVRERGLAALDLAALDLMALGQLARVWDLAVPAREVAALLGPVAAESVAAEE